MGKRKLSPSRRKIKSRSPKRRKIKRTSPPHDGNFFRNMFNAIKGYFTSDRRRIQPVSERRSDNPESSKRTSGRNDEYTSTSPSEVSLPTLEL